MPVTAIQLLPERDMSMWSGDSWLPACEDAGWWNGRDKRATRFEFAQTVADLFRRTPGHTCGVADRQHVVKT